MSNRVFNRAIEEILEEKNITWQSFSYGWIYHLRRGNNTAMIHGYHFGLNGDAESRICQDKSATSDLLKIHNIPHIHHRFFFPPTNQKFCPEDGEWVELIHLLSKYEAVVCKPNEGTGGVGVIVAKSQIELEGAALRILKRGSMCVAPYVDVQDEYRVIVLMGEPRIVYRKIRPSLTGDGHSTIRDLFLHAVTENADLPLPNRDTLERVLEKNEVYYLEWRHNLGKGAKADIVLDAKIKTELSSLACSTANALRVSFASVDIIRTNDHFKVLEVNSGVMMERFLSQCDDYYKLGKAVYSDAIEAMLPTE